MNCSGRAKSGRLNADRLFDDKKPENLISDVNQADDMTSLDTDQYAFNSNGPSSPIFDEPSSPMTESKLSEEDSKKVPFSATKFPSVTQPPLVTTSTETAEKKKPAGHLKIDTKASTTSPTITAPKRMPSHLRPPVIDTSAPVQNPLGMEPIWKDGFLIIIIIFDLVLDIYALVNRRDGNQSDSILDRIDSMPGLKNKL